MSKKLILLILFLPLILMLCLFTATKMVSLVVSVPVSSIQITSPEVVYLDLDEEETHEIEYTVYPTNAGNKSVTFSSEQIGDEPFAKLSYVDGKIVPVTSGKALVYLTTVDGGFKDSFIVQVESNALQSIESRLSLDQIFVGKTANILTEFTPAGAPDKLLRYEVTEGEGVVSVNAQGVVLGLGAGKAKIKIISTANEEVFDEVEITVVNENLLDLAQTEIVTSALSGSIKYSLSGEATLACNVVGDSSLLSLTLDKDNSELDFTFLDESFVGSVTVSLTATSGDLSVTRTCIITRALDVSAEWAFENNVAVKVGNTATLPFVITPSGADVTVTVSLSNDYITATVMGNEVVVKGLRVPTGSTLGETLVTLTVDSGKEVITLTKTVVVFSEL